MRAIVILFVVAGCSSRGSAKTQRANVDPWSTVAIGSVFESRTVTHLERPFVHDESETTTKQTLVARNDSEASIKIEISEGTKLSVQDMKIPFRSNEAPPCEGTTVTTVDDECTVPAGTFQCTRTTVEVRHGDDIKSTVTWTAKSIPVPIKSVVKNENMTTTTELTHLALAR
jgi:hypothetical protein